jgi:hypothetical protein
MENRWLATAMKSAARWTTHQFWISGQSVGLMLPLANFGNFFFSLNSDTVQDWKAADETDPCRVLALR